VGAKKTSDQTRPGAARHRLALLRNRRRSPVVWYARGGSQQFRRSCSDLAEPFGALETRAAPVARCGPSSRVYTGVRRQPSAAGVLRDPFVSTHPPRPFGVAVQLKPKRLDAEVSIDGADLHPQAPPGPHETVQIVHGMPRVRIELIDGAHGAIAETRPQHLLNPQTLRMWKHLDESLENTAFDARRVCSRCDSRVVVERASYSTSAQ
jgi:hypothetical protein